MNAVTDEMQECMQALYEWLLANPTKTYTRYCADKEEARAYRDAFLKSRASLVKGFKTFINDRRFVVKPIEP